MPEENQPSSGYVSPDSSTGSGAGDGVRMPLRRRRSRMPSGQVEEGAGFWMRALARIIDIVAFNVLFLFGILLGGVVLGILIAAGVCGEPDFSRAEDFSPSGMLMALLGGIGYHVICEWLGGASLGKLICGLRVIGQTEGPCRLGPAMLRSLGFFVDGLFFGAVGYLSMHDSPLRQRYGDRWAKTIVAKVSSVPEGAKRPVIALVLAPFAAAALSALLGGISLMIELL